MKSRDPPLLLSADPASVILNYRSVLASGIDPSLPQVTTHSQ